jgi:hypothetical protein
LMPLHICSGMAIGTGAASGSGTLSGDTGGAGSARCQELTVLGKRSLVAFWDSDR